jgi:dihydrofolate reductase
MRKIVTGAFVSLDGVMQAPGGPEEDPTGGFRFGGWIVPMMDEAAGAAVGETFARPFDLLLGRITYDIFAAHWPHFPKDPAAPGYDEGSADIARKFDAATKYVATHRPESLGWQNSRALGDDVVAALRELKKQDGPPLVTQGSTTLIHQLLANDLIDELNLLIFPVVLGRGKRLFDDSSAAATFQVTKSSVSPGGVVIATYQRVGAVQTGSFAFDTPTEAETERRKNLR